MIGESGRSHRSHHLVGDLAIVVVQQTPQRVSSEQGEWPSTNRFFPGSLAQWFPANRPSGSAFVTRVIGEGGPSNWSNLWVLKDAESSVGNKRGRIDKGALVRDQEHRRCGDLPRFRYPPARVKGQSGLTSRRRIREAVPVVDDLLRLDIPRRQCIDPDTTCRILEPESFRKPNEAVLCHRVRK